MPSFVVGRAKGIAWPPVPNPGCKRQAVLFAYFAKSHFIRAIRCEIRTPVTNLRVGVAPARCLGQLNLNRARSRTRRTVRQIEVQRISLTDTRKRVLERRSLVNRHAVAARLVRDLGGSGR